MQKKLTDHKDIKGWGIDADAKNDPTYPMKHRTNEEHKGYSWERPKQQPINIEVLHSNERPNVSATFGTSAPPKGLSGAIRRFAFQHGEGSFAHWIPLILADRVDMIEGLVEDISRGHIPNILAEKGYAARWKYDRKGVIRQAVVTAVVVAAATFWLSGKSKSSNKR